MLSCYKTHVPFSATIDLFSNMPFLVIVFGLPGSGKSFFASQLANLLNANYLNSDKIRKSMFRNRTYTEKEKKAVYDFMMLQMIKFLRNNENVVLDATFYKRELRSAFLNKARGIAKILFIEVRADESLIRERLVKRRNDSEADFHVYEKIKTQWEPMNDNHLILQSTRGNILEMLNKAKLHLPAI